MNKRLSALAILGALLAAACGTKPASDATVGGKGATVAAAGLAVFAPLPSRMEVKGEPVNEQKIALGRALFYETLLSDGHNVSCNSCHALNGFGADGRKASLGFNGLPGGRNGAVLGWTRG
ncbi:MAG: cytochrome-c peroxidase [Gemmatimonadetes bacterium]|nr:cytochrome-c peroxidase [Gemmatimonadota bacterium]